jgi:hypothetical protein
LVVGARSGVAADALRDVPPIGLRRTRFPTSASPCWLYSRKTAWVAACCSNPPCEATLRGGLRPPYRRAIGTFPTRVANGATATHPVDSRGGAHGTVTPHGTCPPNCQRAMGSDSIVHVDSSDDQRQSELFRSVCRCATCRSPGV